MKTFLSAAFLLSIVMVTANGATIQSDDFSGTVLNAQWAPQHGVSVDNSLIVVDPKNDGQAWLPYGVDTAEGYWAPSGDLTLTVDMNVSWSGQYGHTDFVFNTEDGDSMRFYYYHNLNSSYYRGVINGVNGSNVTGINERVDGQLKLVRIGDVAQVWVDAYYTGTFAKIYEASGFSTERGTVQIRQSFPLDQGNAVVWDNFTIVPEPMTLGLLSFGGLLLGFRRRK